MIRSRTLNRALGLLCSALMLGPTSVLANPLGGQVVGGQATIQGQGTHAVTVTQGTQNAIINWNTFNIGVGETTQFIQPNASAIALNRVIGGFGPSLLNGTLTANGRVFLVNPNGVLIGSTGVINTAGFLATTNDIKNSDFMAGNYKFTIPGRLDASIVNLGNITATNGGFAALVAPGVRNAGVITANLGHVALASGNGFTLDFYGDQLITLQVGDKIANKVIDVATGQPLDALVKNEGVLRANGGQVALTAVAARHVVDSVINNKGVIEANSVGMKNGMIVLGAATAATKHTRAKQTVKVSGTLSASGQNKGEKGGVIQITGENIVLAGAKLDASGQAGGGTVLIGAAAAGQGGLTPVASRVSIDSASRIDASATLTGDGGHVVVWSNELTSVAGSITATGGANGGNGGFVETSGQAVDFNGIHVNTSAPSGTAGLWLIDPTNLTVDQAAATTISNNLDTTNVMLQTTNDGATGPGIQTAGAGDIIINASISWSSANTLTLDAYHAINVNAPITVTGAGGLNLHAATDANSIPMLSFGHGANIQFTGTPNSGQSLVINDQNYTLLYSMIDVQNINNGSKSLDGLYALAKPLDAAGIGNWTPIGTDGQGNVLRDGNGFTGVFQGLGNTISNLTINQPLISNVGLFGYVGSNGTIANVNLAGGSFTGNLAVGSLVGWNGGVISNATSTAAVSGNQQVGGLVGLSAGTIVGSHAGGTVTGGENSQAVGGLVGLNNGTVAQSYATGDVSGTAYVGGLVGLNQTLLDSSPTVTQSYATGTVQGSSYVGGLVGFNQDGAINQSYATGAVQGTSSVGGLVGFSTDDAVISLSYASGTVSGTFNVGGLVGYNDGFIQYSYATGAVSGGTGQDNDGMGGLVGYNTGGVFQSYATGAVSGVNNVGGLVGVNIGSITQGYAVGAVTGSANAGGLVGSNGGFISQSFASGAVTGTSNLGGLVGLNSVRIDEETRPGNVNFSYWDKQTTGQQHSAGSADSFGLTTAQSMQHASYHGWDFSTDGGIWFMIDGKTRPFLQSEYSTTITNTHQLQLMAMDLNAHYTLANNISFGTAFSNPSDMWSSQGFVPIGTGGQDGGFAGTFNGRHHKIDGLVIAPTDPNTTNIGLFGVNTGTIKNVRLTNATITANPNSTAPTQYVGTLVGQNYGTISHVSVTGTVNGGNLAGVAAGGLVGQNGVMRVIDFDHEGSTDVPGVIKHASANVAVTLLGSGNFCDGSCAGPGWNYAGGLVGINGGVIDHGSARGAVTVGSQSFAGGLVGQNANFQPDTSFVPLIKNSFAKGDVTSGGVNIALGGLVGANGIGGFGGDTVTVTAKIEDSYSTSNVSATAGVVQGGISVGGLVGQNSGLILGRSLPSQGDNNVALDEGPQLAIHCGAGATCAGGTVTGGGGAQVGGLVGFNEGIVKLAYATGNVHVGTNGTAGGLVGFNTGTLRKTFASGHVTGDAGSGTSEDGGPAQTVLGGLVGENLGVIKKSFAIGAVGSLDVDQLAAGGLVGENSGRIKDSFAFGNVSAGNNSTAGGLAADNNPSHFDCNGCDQGIGQNNKARISHSGSAGAVTVGAQSLAGGLIATNNGTIKDSLAIGNVTAGHDSILGGLVAFGDVNSVIKRSVAAGTVTSTGASSIAGGFIGVNGGQILDSHALAGSIDEHAFGGVNGTSNSYLGGFAGINVGSIQDSTAAGNVTGSGGGNVVGGFVGANAGMIDPSFSSGAVSSGPNSTVGAFAGSNGPLSNLPGNLDPNQSFPGTIDSGSGSTNPGNNPQIGSNNVNSGNPGLPSIVPPCGATTCQVIVAGFGSGGPNDNPNTPPTFDQPPNQQVAPPTNNNDNNPIQINFTTSGPTGPTGGGNGNGNGGNGNGSTKPNYGPAPGPGLGRTADEQQYSGVPPPNETRFRVGELVIQVVDTVLVEQVVATAAKLGLVLISTQHLDQTRRNLFRFRATNPKADFRRLIVALEKVNIFASVQPNYFFIAAQTAQAPAAPAAPATPPATTDQTNSIPPSNEAAPDLANADTAALTSLPAGDAAQYVIDKFHLGAVHRLASGRNVTIAVVDSEIDVTHPDLRGVIVERFDATQTPSKPHAHGTGMAGAIASRYRLLGVAPGVRIIAIKAFDESATSAEATSFQILKGLDYAIAKNVRIINMSFAGPRDPMMERTLKSAHDKGIILIAAAGNAGPKSPPLYPGADQSVIAVSASDFNDKPFTMANRGKYIAVAAPGVDVMVPAPGNGYQLTTGTSVAAAHVSGVAALLVERKPNITPDEVRAILIKTATAFSAKPKGEEDGAGLVDPVGALQSLAGAAKTSDVVPSRAPVSASVH